MLVVTEIITIEDSVLPDDIVNDDGLRETVGPEGDTDAERIMLPESPLILVIVRLEFVLAPAGMLRELGLAEMLKSTTITVTWTERVREPLVAVTVTV